MVGRGGTTVLVCLAIALAAAPGSARDLFNSRIAVTGPGAGNQFFEVESVRDLPDLYSDANLLTMFPGYNPLLSSVTATVDFRGLPAVLSFTPGSAQLSLVVPGVTSVIFNAATLDQAQDLLEDWLKGDFSSVLAPDGSLTDLLQALVRHSPVDPVAGNPNSLQTRMFDADYRLGSEGPFLSGATIDDAEGLFSTGPEVATTNSGPFRVRRVELPLSYRVNFDNPWVSLLFDLPLALTETEGQLSGLGSLALGLQIRPFSFWSLTPLVRVGAVGSIDVGAAALLYSGSLTSRITIPLGDFELGISNQGGYARTYDDIRIRGIHVEYELINSMTRNGGSISGPLGFSLGEHAIGFEVFGSDTRFFGDKLFNDYQDEVGGALVAFGEIAGARYQSLHLGAAYVFGDDTDGVRAELRLRF